MPLRQVRAASCVVLFAFAIPTRCAASESATTSVSVAAAFSSRTSLKVSARLLQFAVAQPGEEAIAVVDFSAGARTGSGGEVVLTVELVRGPEGPGGAGDVEAAVTFSGDGEGTRAGALHTSTASVAGRWKGSGLRTGRLTFALRATVPGTYSLPVRFVLSTP